MDIEQIKSAPLATLKREFGDPLRIIISPKGSISLVHGPLPYRRVLTEIAAQTGDSVNLMDHGEHVMLVDDIGHKSGKPLNAIATALYWEKCGGPVEHTIVGTVYVCPDEDFA